MDVPYQANVFLQILETAQINVQLNAMMMKYGVLEEVTIKVAHYHQNVYQKSTLMDVPISVLQCALKEWNHVQDSLMKKVVRPNTCASTKFLDVQNIVQWIALMGHILVQCVVHMNVQFLGNVCLK